MPQWETHRGDEWWYRDDAVEAGAAVNMTVTPPAFIITVRPRADHGRRAARLLHLLCLTMRQLPEFELWCSLDRYTQPLLDQLAGECRIRWEFVGHPHSGEARILEVASEQTSG